MLNNSALIHSLLCIHSPVLFHVRNNVPVEFTRPTGNRSILRWKIKSKNRESSFRRPTGGVDHAKGQKQKVKLENYLGETQYPKDVVPIIVEEVY